MTQIPLTALIVTYNSGRVIRGCLQAAVEHGIEPLVIDNASEDNTAEVVERFGCRMIRNATNRGFAAAVNQGVCATSTPFILLLNPDATLLTDVAALLEACRRLHAGAVGGQLVSPAGVPQRGFNVRKLPTPVSLFFECSGLNRLWPENPVNWRYRCLGLDLTQPAEVEQPAGAFLMFRRDAWKQIGGFDEGFTPLWFEDVDFCKRLRDRGLQVWYIPAAIARHEGAHSVDSLGAIARTEYWYRSLLRYSIRHFDVIGRICVCLGAIAGAPLRLLFRGNSAKGTGQGRAGLLHIHVAVVRLAFRSVWMRKVQFGESVS